MEHIYSSYLFQFSLTRYTMMISILGLFSSVKTFWGVTALWGAGGDTWMKEILVEADDAREQGKNQTVKDLL